MALATNSPLIRIYNRSTLDARLLSSHADTVLCLDATSDGTILASAGKDKSARLWMLSSASDRSEMDWSCVAVAEGHAESIGALALSRNDAPSPQFMFTGSQDRTVKMWDITNVKSSPSNEAEKLKSLLTLKVHDKGINSLDVAPNDKLLATGSQDKTANIYEIEFVSGAKLKGSLKLLGTCKGHKRGVWCVKFSRTERFVATASGDKSIKLWSLDDFSCLKVSDCAVPRSLKLTLPHPRPLRDTQTPYFELISLLRGSNSSAQPLMAWLKYGRSRTKNALPV